MDTLHNLSRTSKPLEPPRPAFVTSAGVMRRSAQGDVRRCTAVDLALMSASAMVIWRLEARRQKQEGSAMNDNIISLTVRIGDDGPPVKMKGRDAWALAKLIKVGDTGIDIGTIHEAHAGAYSGHHARYVLRSPVTVMEREVTT